jgi:hypothetical protein
MIMLAIGWVMGARFLQVESSLIGQHILIDFKCWLVGLAFA